MVVDNSSTISVGTIVSRCFSGISYSVCCVGTLILIVVIQTQQRRTKLFSSTSMALSALLLADLLYLLCNYKFIFDPMGIDQNSGILVFFDITGTTFFTVQGYFQCVVSIERVIAIVRPREFQTIVTKRRMKGILFYILHIISFSQVLVSFFDSKFFVMTVCDSTVTNVNMTITCKDQVSRVTSIFLLVNISVIRCGLPLLVLLICTVLIIVSLIKRSRASLASVSQRAHTREFVLAAVLLLMDILIIVNYAIVIVRFIQISQAYGYSGRTFVMSIGIRAVAPSTDWFILLFCRNLRAAVRSAISDCVCSAWRRITQSTTIWTRNVRFNSATAETAL